MIIDATPPELRITPILKGTETKENAIDSHDIPVYVPISYQDLYYYQQSTGNLLASWQCDWLVDASRAYCMRANDRGHMHAPYFEITPDGIIK